MIEHIVLFKLKDTASEEQVEAMLSALAGLRSAVPGIVDLSVGKNFSERGQGFGIGLVVRFENREALDAYIPHPAHRGCVDQFVKPIAAELIVADYEIG